MDTPTWPSTTLLQVTTSDSTLFTQGVARQLYIGVGGDVSVYTQAGTTILFKNVPSGGVIAPFYITRVNTTGTTATNIVAFI